MDKVFNYLNGFFSGLAGVLLTLLPLNNFMGGNIWRFTI